MPQAFLDAVDRALLTTSVHLPDTELSPDTEVPDVGSMLERYRGKGVDFIVDVGRRIVTQSTVVDMTGAQGPEVVREGRGDPTVFEW
jgi:tRNA A37 threonylcarbamoyladenosine synthetase subunit TsaC/SUA5/YrdC